MIRSVLNDTVVESGWCDVAVSHVKVMGLVKQGQWIEAATEQNSLVQLSPFFLQRNPCVVKNGVRHFVLMLHTMFVIFSPQST